MIFRPQCLKTPQISYLGQAEYHVERKVPSLPVGQRSRFFDWARRGRELPHKINFILLA